MKRYRAFLYQTNVPSVLVILCLTLALSSLPPRAGFSQEATQEEFSLPLSPIEKAEKDGTALQMSLKDLTKLALQNNLDIAISDTNEELFNLKVTQAYGPYDPALTVGLGVSSYKRPNTNLATASLSGNSNKSDQANWNFQFDQNIPWGGGIRAQWNTTRSDNNQAFSLFTPQYNANAAIQFTQPLGRNRRIDDTRGQIKIVNLDLKTNDSQFKQKVTDTIATIQNQYWDLVGAIRDYEIKREAVRLAQITLRDNKKKVEIGTLAPIGITEAQADMANRQVDLITSEERIYNVENALRALISNDRSTEIWSRTIVPTETPDYTEFKVDPVLAIDTALQNRPELEQLDIKIKQDDIRYEMTANKQKWQFDLVGAFGSIGVAGPQSYNVIGNPQVPEDLVGAMGTAYKTVFTGGFINWSVSFNVQIPLKNRTVESQLAQNRIQKRQNLMNRKGLEQQIQVDIRNALQHIETNKQQVATAKVARQLAKEQLDGEEKRFQAGLSENFLVLDRQRALSAAQGRELNALIDYRKSIISLQKAMYTLLESSDFAIAKTSADSVPDLK